MKSNEELNEKIESLLSKLESNETDRKNIKTDSWIIRLSGVMITTVCVLVISFMVDISERVTTMEVNKVDKEFVLDNYISRSLYNAIENQRTSDLVQYITLIGRSTNIKEEELEEARTTAVRHLNMYVQLGTTRGSD